MVEVRVNPRLNLVGCGLIMVSAISLFIGLMIATAGFAIYPPVANIATPLTCDGQAVQESIGSSYRPGQYTVSRSIYCVSGGPKGAREDITMKTMGVAFLLYSAIAFVLLVLLGMVLRRKSRDLMKAPNLGGATWSVRPPGPGESGGMTGTTTTVSDGVTISTGPASPADISSILAKVAEAVQRGGPNVVVRNMSYDAQTGNWTESGGAAGEDGDESGDPGERLTRLKQLYDQGLITAAEYQQKRSEILSGL